MRICQIYLFSEIIFVTLLWILTRILKSLFRNIILHFKKLNSENIFGLQEKFRTLL